MRLVSFFTLFFASVLAFAQVPPPVVAANSWLMLDYTSGQVLASRDPDKRIEPASLTKLMTAYITFSALREGKIKREQEVPVSEKAWKMEGSRMFIEPGKPVTVGELIQGMIVQSGNDACVALAEAIAGSTDAFVHIMNQEAKRLGMVNTHFTNTTGLPDAAHYTTARDLSILAAAVVRDFPEDYSTYSQKEFRYNNIPQRNRNRLLWTDPTVDGMKTGHTDSAGYCLIASAKRGERRIITVVTGTSSEAARAEESLKLLNHGFLFYDTVRLYSAAQAVSTLPVWKGASNEVQAGFQRDFLMTVPKDQANKLKVDFVSLQPVIAPIAKGQQVGTLKVSLDGRALGEYPVLALQEVPLAGWFGRTWDALRLWIKSL
ncbi:D-alanyl-D-alanine carboxypeptidase family protein [Cognatazoarcus halotolerans]|uniref:D-alanyl-D-alanine carboxypeptidase family protein n=1 Tax=Cognatazoarcus halotolerans TaxID=2686016 RepID=UPI0013583A6C|nr:D-alanyl-D-alanine carboxypeptidase family protein [Cognatazoarcus halotolerans]MCB1898202.1 D-alanyl-D-alanine carboxypeptidase [Rhodocyclaceae bacterium]MCP5311715.1 D-alanyl-D-alanine carboxypeptidase [Zoogloeaceae bacterium]